MKLEVYERVIADIDRLPFDFILCLEGLQERYPEEPESELKGVIGQYYQRLVKKSFAAGSRNPLLLPENRRKLLSEFERRCKADPKKLGVIREIAIEHRFSAALTGKLLLEEWLAREAGGTKPTKPVLREHFKEPGFIQDGRLSCEVSHANLVDENYGPTAEFSKHAVGFEYEARLRNQILDLGLDFLDESEQRERGFDKTPDIKLEVPIAVDGCVVNWIESKALFGDQENHASYLKDQLWSYWNRFGPGMVIYWFGHIEELKHNTRHSGILVADAFPDKDKIVFFDPARVPAKSSFSPRSKEEEEAEIQQLEDRFKLDLRMGKETKEEKQEQEPEEYDSEEEEEEVHSQGVDHE